MPVGRHRCYISYRWLAYKLRRDFTDEDASARVRKVDNHNEFSLTDYIVFYSCEIIDLYEVRNLSLPKPQFLRSQDNRVES